jgi:hypothetical protein
MKNLYIGVEVKTRIKTKTPIETKTKTPIKN